MIIDLSLVAKIAAPVALLFIGALINRYFERRPKLTTYYGHVSAFRLRTPEQFEVFTHSIVIRNAGSKAANGVRVGHNVLPRDYQIFPSATHEVRKVPDTGDEIFIPAMVPGEQITISYLYSPPLTYNQINTYVKSDEGFAKVLQVISTPQAPRWLHVVGWTLISLGAIMLIYLVITFWHQLYLIYNRV